MAWAAAGAGAAALGRAARAGAGAPAPRAAPRCPSPRPAAAAAAGRDPGLLEWRTYHLHPEGQTAYMAQSAEYAGLRRKVFPNWRGFWSCDVGGALNAVHHVYHWESVSQRSEHRARAAENADWAAYVSAGKQYLRTQEATLFRSTSAVLDAAKAASLEEFSPEPADAAVYELRTYRLKLGYDTVPKFLEAFAQGVPHKIAADTVSELAFFGFVDVGRLNKVIELWRYPSAEASMRAREASRGVQQWRDTIAAVTPLVQDFHSEILLPAAFSPVR